MSARGPREIVYEWRGSFDNAELNALHAEAFGHAVLDDDWNGQVHGHSLGWVCARKGGQVVGFVNVAWDGGVHAFILDTLVSASARRHGIGTQLVALATEQARAAGCEWLSQPRVEATRIRARHVTQPRGHGRPPTHQGVQVGLDSGSGYQPVK